MQQVAGQRVLRFDFIGVDLVRVSPDRALPEAISTLNATGAVEYAECNYRQYAVRSPNDPQYPQQWGFPKISAPVAWDRLTEARNVVVAVIDTGVSLNHPDLVPNLWLNPAPTFGDAHGANFVPATPTGNPDDDNRHGTHVAGTIGAVSNNGLGVAGTTWATNIMAVKFLDAN